MKKVYSNTTLGLITTKWPMEGAKQVSNFPYDPYDPDDPTTVRVPAVMGEARPQAHETTGRYVESQAEYVEYPNLMRANLRFWVTRVVYFVLGVLEVIMGLRFVFRLLGANPDNDFVRVLYDLSLMFVTPFNGIFNDQTIGRTGVFEISTLIAMLIYALIAWGLVALGRVIFAPSLTDDQRVIQPRRSRNSQ